MNSFNPIATDIQGGRSARTQRLTSVDQMRFFAAFLVVFSHSYFWTEKTATALGTSFFIPFFKQGYGAIVFMCLSGYLLTHISYEKFGNKGAIEFITRRLARIAPLYWLFTSLFIVLLFIFPATVTKNSLSWPNTIGSYIFFPTERPFDGHIKPVFSSGWTLNYIVFFYFILGISLRFSKYHALLLICSAYLILLAAHPFVSDVPALAFWSDKYGLLFMGGAVAAFAAKAVGTRIVLTLPMLALCAVLATSSWFLGAPWAIVVMLTAVMFAMASLVKPSANPFTARVWTAAGDISYSVILSHPFVIGMVSKVFVVLSAERLVPVWVLLPASIIAAFVVGALVYRLVERPMAEHIRRQLDRLFDRTNRPVIRPAI